jgi:hypothetical protein
MSMRTTDGADVFALLNRVCTAFSESNLSSLIVASRKSLCWA